MSAESMTFPSAGTLKEVSRTMFEEGEFFAMVQALEALFVGTVYGLVSMILVVKRSDDE